jgi:NAD(P)-dependent dehydrogenase (short-subunit alcohol dehydrogenase family)
MDSQQTRVAIVTGASRGLGRATALSLARAGWVVIIDARDGTRLDAVAAEIAETGDEPVAVPGDITSPEHRASLVEAARRVGRLDLLVNNASALGPSPQPTLDGYPLDTLRMVYETNVFAPLAMTQEALPLLRESSGVIINVSSDAAVGSYEGWGGYGSSKAALDQLSNVLAAEEPTLRIYAFDPGDMNTQMHQEAFPGEDISDRPDPEERVPALMELIGTRPGSGRYDAEQFLNRP